MVWEGAVEQNDVGSVYGRNRWRVKGEGRQPRHGIRRKKIKEDRDTGGETEYKKVCLSGLEYSRLAGKRKP